MSDIREQRIYCAEQIYVPENLPLIIKNYSKAVIKNHPDDMVQFSMKYFENLLKQRDREPDKTGYSEINKPNTNQIQQKSQQLTEDRLRIFFNHVDSNGSGKVSAYELQDHLSKNGYHFSNDQVQLFLDKHDKNNDHLLNFDEFKLMAEKCGLNK
jgi:Ca2+-binding EF-hand superfamily protein